MTTDSPKLALVFEHQDYRNTLQFVPVSSRRAAIDYLVQQLTRYGAGWSSFESDLYALYSAKLVTFEEHEPIATDEEDPDPELRAAYEAWVKLQDDLANAHIEQDERAELARLKAKYE